MQANVYKQPFSKYSSGVMYKLSKTSQLLSINKNNKILSNNQLVACVLKDDVVTHSRSSQMKLHKLYHYKFNNNMCQT